MISISKEKSFWAIEKQNSKIRIKIQELENAQNQYLRAFESFKKINNIENNQFDHIFLHPERYFFVSPWNTNQKVMFQKKGNSQRKYRKIFKPKSN